MSWSKGQLWVSLKYLLSNWFPGFLFKGLLGPQALVGRGGTFAITWILICYRQVKMALSITCHGTCERFHLSNVPTKETEFARKWWCSLTDCSSSVSSDQHPFIRSFDHSRFHTCTLLKKEKKKKAKHIYRQSCFEDLKWFTARRASRCYNVSTFVLKGICCHSTGLIKDTRQRT